MHALLIDDQALFRQALKFILSDLDRSIGVLETDSCEEALELAHAPGAPPVDLVLLDMDLPGKSGMEALAAVRDACACATLVALAQDGARARVREAIEHGASGVIMRSATPAACAAALRRVLAGGACLPAHVFAAAPGREPAVAQARPPALHGLSVRQLDFLFKAIQGRTAAHIATECELDTDVVEGELRIAFRALGAASRTEAVYAAAQYGITRAG